MRTVKVDQAFLDDWKNDPDCIFLDINLFDIPRTTIATLKTLPVNVRKISIVDHMKPTQKILCDHIGKDRGIEIVWKENPYKDWNYYIT